MNITDRCGGDLLEEIEYQIAKRADELAAASPLRTGLNLHWWTQAEYEMLGAPAAVTAPAETNDPVRNEL